MTQESTEQPDNEYSPWKHPKAQRWYAELLEKTNLPLMIEDALEKPDADLSAGQTRMFVAMLVMIGRKGIWPDHRKNLIRFVIRKAAALLNQKQSVSKKPLTLSEHRQAGKTNIEIEHEVELLRRRIGMSNRNSKIGAPKWGRFWE